MAEHTPGPWNLVGPTGDRKAILIEQKADGWHRLAVEVESDDCDFATAEANAWLIAAAPDLLDALKKVVAVADRKTDEFDAARAAIRKAEGTDQAAGE